MSAKTNIFPVLNYSSFYQTKVVPPVSLDKLMDFDLERVVVMFILLRNAVNKKAPTDVTHPVILALILRLGTSKSTRAMSFLTDKTHPFVLTHGVVISKIVTDLFKIMSFNAPKESMESAKLEQAIFDVLMIYNEHHYEGTLEPKPDDHQVVWRILLMQEISGLNEIDYTRTAIPKHLIFDKFLKTKLGDQYKVFEQILLEKTGVTIPLEFLVILLNVYLSATQAKNGLVFIDRADRTYQILIDAGLVIDAKSVDAGKFDVGILVSHPFFRNSEGEMYLIDFSDFALITDKIWSYFLYTIPEIRALFPGVRSPNEYFSYLGKEYVEQYLLRTLFLQLHKTGNRVLFTEDKNLPDIALILNEKDVFLFEVKASALHYNVMAQKSVANFQEFLDLNFSRDKKGVKQLVRNIEYLSTDSGDLYELRCPQKKLTIYPLIIYTDPHLDKNAVNDYINVSAKPLLDMHRHSFKEIKPVTMISADFFVENINLLRKDRSLLKRMIEAYYKQFKKRMEKYAAFRSTENYMNAMISFDQFVAGQEGLYRTDKLKILNELTELFKLRETGDE